jgi:hypothetical protein
VLKTWREVAPVVQQLGAGSQREEGADLEDRRRDDQPDDGAVDRTAGHAVASSDASVASGSDDDSPGASIEAGTSISTGEMVVLGSGAVVVVTAVVVEVVWLAGSDPEQPVAPSARAALNPRSATARQGCPEPSTLPPWWPLAQTRTRIRTP